MIKKWDQFIKEFVNNNNGNDYIGSKMQELKDLVDGVSNGQNFIYEWESKNDHQLLVNFSTVELSIRYEFDIDDLILTKVVGEKVDFTDKVESIEEGLDMIEKDIQLILGVSESISENSKRPINEIFVGKTGMDDAINRLNDSRKYTLEDVAHAFMSGKLDREDWTSYKKRVLKIMN